MDCQIWNPTILTRGYAMLHFPGFYCNVKTLLMHIQIIGSLLFLNHKLLNVKKITVETHLTIISTIFVGEDLQHITDLVIQVHGDIEHCKLRFKIYQCTLSVSTHISFFANHSLQHISSISNYQISIEETNNSLEFLLQISFIIPIVH